MKAGGLAVVDFPPNLAAGLNLLLDATAKKYAPEAHTDHWRRKAASALIFLLPMCRVHVGGHHIALHAPGPVMEGAMGEGPCMARIVETRGGKPV